MRFLITILVLLVSMAGQAQILQPNASSTIVDRWAVKNGFRVPQVATMPVTKPDLNNYTGDSASGGMIYCKCVADTVNRGLHYWQIDHWIKLNTGSGGTGGSGIQSIVGGYRITIDTTDPANPIVNSMDTSWIFIFEAPIQGNVSGDTVYVYLDSTGNGDYSIAHHSFGYYLGVFLTSAQAANTYITYDSAQGRFMDTAYLSNDTIYGVKNGAPFYIATTGGSGSVEYVISGLGTQVDSSGRAYTVNVDTSSTVILSRQRAAATYVPLIRTVTAGVGLSGGGALSSNITLNVDTLVISTRAWRDKLADSLGALIALRVKYSDTASMLSPYVRRVLAGTNVTVDNTNAQYPIVSASGTGSGITKAYAPLIVSSGGDSISRRYNVVAYGADPTGVSNSTTAIQAAINACSAAGGGEVFFPRGTYLISGALGASNSQLYIPPIAATSASRTHIIFMGEGAPNFVPVGGGLSGGAAIPIASSPVILKSSLTSGASGCAVIGTEVSSSGFNETFLSVQNIAIQVKNNPGGIGPVVGGISYKNGSSLQCKNVAVYIDTSGYRSVLPGNDITGIETPDNSAETFNLLENTLVVGFRSGYKIGEHTVLIQAQAMTCYYGIYAKTATHTISSLRAAVYWCPYDLYIRGTCALSNFQLDGEWQQIGKWYDDVATIKDSANLSKGAVYYTITAAGGSVDNTKFSKSGGSNLWTASNANITENIAILTTLTTANKTENFTIMGSTTIGTTTGDVGIKLFTPNTGTTNTDGFNFGIENSTKDVYINQREAANTFFYSNGAEAMRITSAQRVGIKGATPTAWLHLAAGAAAASSAPLKFTSGTNLTTPEAGAMEFNGTNLFFSPSTTRYTVVTGLAGSATLDFASTGAGAVADLTITVTGAADGDAVSLGVPNASITATATFTAWVSAANTVTVRFSPKATEDPASGTFKVFVKKN